MNAKALPVQVAPTPRTVARCIHCSEPFAFGINVFTQAGAREVGISGSCEKCFDAGFANECRPVGRLTVRDLNNALPNCAESLPYPLPTEPYHTGETVTAPAPLRDFDCERSWRWWPYACALAVLLGAVVPPLFAGLVR